MARRTTKVKVPEALRLRNLIPLMVLIVTGIFVFNGLNDFITDSPYFKVNKVDIVIVGKASLTNRTVKDLLSIHNRRNIFDVDLGATRDYILSNYPEIRMIVINRVLPDKLVLNIRPRKPVAQANVMSGFYLVDAEGVVLPGASSLVFGDLPIINGLDSRLVISSVGKKCGCAGLKRALRLLDVINQINFSQGHEVHMIDVSDEKNLSLYIEGGIEIKIGAENFRERICILNKTLEAGKLDKNQIRYIDLRFGNVIIGPK